MSKFICPVCNMALSIQDKSYKCKNNHCFDISKSGYTNLLLSNQMNSKLPGDNKLMVISRKEFLEKGYYNKLSDNLCCVINKYCCDKSVILDAGCGEGYYTTNVYNSLLKNNKHPLVYGIDISKNALLYASKKTKEIEYAVASIFHIPMEDKSCDILMTLFAPFCGEEFSRVIKDKGSLVMVIPSENHLWELKSAVYDNPYKNEVKEYEIKGFSLIEKIIISDEIYLDNKKDIADLFTMTPYYYKTSEADQKKLYSLEELKTKIEFEILVYKKTEV